MRTPIALFTCNRPAHTDLASAALARCRRLDECQMDSFCDGPKSPEQAENVATCRTVVRTWAARLHAIVVERSENLGLDPSAVAAANGRLVCGVEEERLNRIKHWAGFPSAGIGTVLTEAGAALGDVDAVAISRAPGEHLLDKALYAFRGRPGLSAIRSRLSNHPNVQDVDTRLARLAPGVALRAKVFHVEHHRAHLASAFFCSPFEEAACLTVDGFGDFVSSMSAVGRGKRIEVLDGVMFPHSLDIFYTAVTQFLGFPKYGTSTR